MSPIDPHLIKTPPPPPRPLDADRPCAGCGYNLRGLAYGSACPECGLVSARTVQGLDDPLAMMPLSVIRTLRLGCWSASLWVLAVMFIVVLNAWRGMAATTFASLLFVASVLWVIAVLMLTPSFTLPQAIWRGFGRNNPVRRAARWLQLGWVFAAGVKLTTVLAPASWTTAIGWIYAPLVVIGVIVGFAGIIVLGVLMQELADWVRDDLAARTINFSMWMLPISTPLLFVNVPIPFVGIILGLLWLAAVGAYPYGLLSVARSVELSVHHAHEYRERLARRREREQQYTETVGQTVAEMDQARRERGHTI